MSGESIQAALQNQHHPDITAEILGNSKAVSQPAAMIAMLEIMLFLMRSTHLITLEPSAHSSSNLRKQVLFMRS